MTEARYVINAEDKTKAANDSAIGNMGRMVKSLVDVQALLGLVSQAWNAMQGAVKYAMGEYTEALSANTKLDQVLRSTGNALGLSSMQIRDYADELQNLTGIDADLIVKNSAMMATFTRIGKDVFPEAIARAADMTDMFGSMEAATMQIGKALNDPIQGVSALRRVGVQLTDQQEEMVKTMVEAGNVMGAQKIILSELKTEFGGVAEAIGGTFIGSMRKLEANIGDVAAMFGEQIANFVKPGIDAINQFLVDHKKQIANAVKNLPEIFALAFDTIGKIIKKTFQPDTFSALFEQLGRLLLFSFQTSMEMLPFLIANLFKSGGALLTIISGNLFIAIGDAVGKALGVDMTKNKDRIKLTAEVEAATKTLGSSMTDLGGRFTSTFQAYMGKLGDVAKETAGLYNAEFTDFYTKLGVILNKEEKIIDAVTGKAGGSVGGEIAAGNWSAPSLEGWGVFAQVNTAAEQWQGSLLGLFQEQELVFGEFSDDVLAASDSVKMFSDAMRINAEFAGYEAVRWGGKAEEKPGFDIMGALGDFGSKLWEAVKGIEAFKIILDPVSSILKYAVDFARGAINEALKPLVGVIIIIGQLIGAFLIPVFNALAPVIKFIAEAFVGLYNFAILPLANFIIGFINVVGMAIAAVVNAIIGIVNALGGNMKQVKMPGLTDNMLKPIDFEALTNTADAALAGGSGGGGSTITGGREVTVNVHVYNPVLLDGSNTTLDALAGFIVKYARLGEEVGA